MKKLEILDKHCHFIYNILGDIGFTRMIKNSEEA